MHTEQRATGGSRVDSGTAAHAIGDITTVGTDREMTVGRLRIVRIAYTLERRDEHSRSVINVTATVTDLGRGVIEILDLIAHTSAIDTRARRAIRRARDIECFGVTRPSRSTSHSQRGRTAGIETERRSESGIGTNTALIITAQERSARAETGTGGDTTPADVE